ncbi:MAG TPA: rhomboid family intramembrane serine protease [Candidatus Limnocylindrales bacterium]|jgi:membrane associated rhomboid family serine protease|nr:rhomboid family intramembrane serine protease [Candidatus Limnocylindrales bacterium]
MDESTKPDRLPDLDTPGPLTLAQARLILDGGAERLSAGEFADAFRHYRRVIGFDDPQVTAAALLGAAQSRFRMDDEAGAVATWEAILELPETPSTYHAWREIAAARVRDGDLQGAIAAYREADRRAPASDKAEIATRLGWLAKETGNVRASRRYFARGRGSVLPLATYAIIGLTVVISLTAIFSAGGELVFGALALDKVAVANGEFWRLLTVTLVHGGESVSAAPPDEQAGAALLGLMHLGFNMYALYLCGPIVEQIYGPIRMLLFYLVAAAGGSIASFALGDVQGGVGASGAIFGLFGILFAASRLHVPMVDRRARALLGQIGSLIVINVLIGFSLGFVDNMAHLGGLAAGLLIAVGIPPGRVPTLRSMWQATGDRQVSTRFIGSPVAMVGALVALLILMAIGMAMGIAKWR